jgi:signal recognition particle GTPase
VVGNILSEMKTSQRQEEKRKQQLELMEQQIKDGTLVVRKMTQKERAKYPPRPQAKGSTRGKRRARS